MLGQGKRKGFESRDRFGAGNEGQVYACGELPLWPGEGKAATGRPKTVGKGSPTVTWLAITHSTAGTSHARLLPLTALVRYCHEWV